MVMVMMMIIIMNLNEVKDECEGDTNEQSQAKRTGAGDDTRKGAE